MEKKKKSSAKSEDKSSTLTHRLTGKILLSVAQPDSAEPESEGDEP